jgi:hypothetical protein
MSSQSTKNPRNGKRDESSSAVSAHERRVAQHGHPELAMRAMEIRAQGHHLRGITLYCPLCRKDIIFQSVCDECEPETE